MWYLFWLNEQFWPCFKSRECGLGAPPSSHMCEENSFQNSFENRKAITKLRTFAFKLGVVTFESNPLEMILWKVAPENFLHGILEHLKWKHTQKILNVYFEFFFFSKVLHGFIFADGRILYILRRQVFADWQKIREICKN